MAQKSKFSTEEKLEYVLRCVEGKDSIKITAKLIGIHHSSLHAWIVIYQSLGIDGLTTTSKNISLTAAEREMPVKAYLSGQGSLGDICKDYGIR